MSKITNDGLTIALSRQRVNTINEYAVKINSVVCTCVL